MASAKQKKALAILVESGGKTPVGRAMVEAGYSPATAKTPQKLTESKAFSQIMEEAGITDIKLSEVLKDGLEATKAVVMGKESAESFVDVQPDYAIRHKYLETGLKMKGLVPKSDAITPALHFHNHQTEQKEKYKL